jgi:DNA-binding response OmpR family regulator
MGPSSPTRTITAAPALLFVDDDADLRDTIRETVAFLGLGGCVLAGSLADVESQHAEALACSLAILDINLGPDAPTGIDVYQWLREARFPGTIIFLTGHGADDPRVREATHIAASHLLTKPISAAQLAALAREARKEA